MGAIPRALPASIVALALAITGAPAKVQAETTALEALLERQDRGAGFTDGRVADRSPLGRWEAAALLQSCLARSPTVTDALLRLVEEFAPELKQLQGRMAELEGRLAQLEATAFSTTTTLSGESHFVLGGTAYGGDVATNLPGTNPGNAPRNGVSFNYELRLIFQTSFTGKDLLYTRLRSGNFNASAFDGTPVRLSKIDAAFSPTVTVAGGGSQAAENGVRLDRLFYRFPISRQVTLQVGPLSRNNDTLAIFPSVYGNRGDRVLEFFTFYGAPAVYNKATGVTLGAIWMQQKPKGRGRWGGSLSYVAQRGRFGEPSAGGLFNGNSGANLTAQVGYQAPQWALAAAIRNGQADTRANVGTSLGSAILAAGEPGSAAFSLNLAISGYWQPLHSGWFPSISAGWGSSWIRQNAEAFPTPQPLNALTNVRASRSWSLAFAAGERSDHGDTSRLLPESPLRSTDPKRRRRPECRWPFQRPGSAVADHDQVLS